MQIIHLHTVAFAVLESLLTLDFITLNIHSLYVITIFFDFKFTCLYFYRCYIILSINFSPYYAKYWLSMRFHGMVMSYHATRIFALNFTQLFNIICSTLLRQPNSLYFPFAFQHCLHAILSYYCMHRQTIFYLNLSKFNSSCIFFLVK